MEPLFSIGHSNQSLEAFLALLRAHEIDVLADVRSQPYSKFVPWFNAASLKIAVERSGKRYLFLGKELGGRPDGDEFYDAAGHVLYARVAEAPFFLEGLARLENGMQRYRIAIMCSEEDPAVCHRYLLIGCVLSRRGIELNHLRGDGRVELQSEVIPQGKTDKRDLQLSFLPQAEVDEWKSLRSVLRRDPRMISSEH